MKILTGRHEHQEIMICPNIRVGIELEVVISGRIKRILKVHSWVSGEYKLRVESTWNDCNEKRER